MAIFNENKKSSKISEASHSNELATHTRSNFRQYGPSASIDFANNREFLRFLLKEVIEVGIPGGISSTALLKEIGRWNMANPTERVHFSKSSFEHLAGSMGSKSTINEKEIYLALNISPESRSILHNKEFLKFLLSSQRNDLSDGGFTILEVMKAAHTWNKIHSSNPNQHVLVNRNSFEQLARRDNSHSSGSELTISKDEILFFANDTISTSLPENTQSHLAFGNLNNWKHAWSTLKLPFSYNEFQKAITSSLTENSSIFKTARGDIIAIQDAMRMVSIKTGISSFVGTKTLSQAEQDRLASLNPFIQFQERHEQHQMVIANYNADLNRAVSEKEKQFGRKMSPDEIKHFTIGYELDTVIRSVIEAPGALYQGMSGITRSQAPYAYAALDFLGGLAAAAPTILKQIAVGIKNPELYLKDVLSNLPGNINQILASLNLFDPKVSGPERFSRALNIVALLAAGKGQTVAEIGKAPPTVKALFVCALTKVRPSKQCIQTCKDVAHEMEEGAKKAPGAESDEKIVKRFIFSLKTQGRSIP